MTTDQIVSLLIAERDKLNRAIQALGAPAQSTAPLRHRGMSAAKRKAVSERMKAYWAARRKKKG